MNSALVKTVGRSGHSRGRRWLALVVTLLGLTATGIAAEAPRWRALADNTFTNFAQEAGLPGPLATAVAEDGDGFLWVGTQAGLARWDGYRYKVYKPDPRDAMALPDNWIQVLHTDPKGRLWIGTNGGGLARYEAGSDRFKAFAVGAKGLSHVLVHAIADDGAGGLWVGTDGGLAHIAADSDTITHIPHIADPTKPLGQRVTALLQDRQGGLWVGTQAGLLHRPQPGSPFVAVPLGAPGTGGFSIRSLVQDSKGQLWIGTMGQGAWLLQAGSMAAVTVRATTAGGGVLERDRVLAIRQVTPDEVWLGTYGSGIVAVDIASLQTRQMRNNPVQPSSLPSNTVWALHRQANGLIWIGHGRGLSRYDPSQAAVLTVLGSAGSRDGLSDPDVTSVLPTPDGRVWLGLATNGVDIVDPVGRRVAELRPGAMPATSLAKDFVWNMVASPARQVYLGTLRGLYRAELSGKGLQRLALERPNPAASVDAMHLDGSTLWMGSWGDGLWALDVATTGLPKVLRRIPGERLTDRRINAIQKGADGALWIGTANGLNRYDPASDTVEKILPDPASGHGLAKGSITALLLDPQRRLWVSTLGGGIGILQGHTADGQAQFRTLNTQQGLPNNNVNKLLLDAAGQVWASTDDGVAKIDMASLAIRPLRREDGVQIAAYWGGAGASTAANEMLFGGGGGLSIVRPERLAPWQFAAPLAITQAWVGDLPVTSPRSPAGDPAPLVVQAHANSLAVEFAALDLSAPERNQYAYRLDGFDRVWKTSDASRRIAAYTNLPPGDYTLRMRGSNRNGVWTERELLLPVTVRPAWYQTAWFRLAALVLVALAVYLIVQARTAYLRRVQRVLEAKVAERTASLQATSRALEEKSRALEEASLTDPLTGLRNRRFLSLNLDADIALHLRHHENAAVAQAAPQDADLIFFLIDIDHFKQVNDVHGHAAGDAVLMQMRERLQRVFRDSDFLVRWGGEEFLVVARGTHRDQGATLAERVRHSVCSEPFRLDDGRPLPKTCSLGFAFFPFFLGDPSAVPWPDVVEVADAALYAAKRAGRDGWVGVAADEAAARGGFVADALADLHGAVARGDVHLQSSREPTAVLDALAPAGTSEAAASTPG